MFQFEDGLKSVNKKREKGEPTWQRKDKPGRCPTFSKPNKNPGIRAAFVQIFNQRLTNIKVVD